MAVKTPPKEVKKYYLCGCGKKCTSKSGLTLHLQRCGKENQDGPQADQEASEAAAEAASDDADEEDVDSTFHKHCVRDEILTSSRKTWTSKCGKWRVVLMLSKYGLSNRWMVMKLSKLDDKDFWDIESEHKRKKAAFKVAVKAARDATASAMARIEKVVNR